MKYRYFVYGIIIVSALLFDACRHRNKERSDSRRTRSERVAKTPETKRERSAQDKSVVRMRKEGGVYHIPCKINGMEMEFIFDTGASDIIMSLTEAMFLYKQGKLTDNDFIDKQQYKIADGSICEGMIVMLREVKIGNRTLGNVKASIIDNMEAPLLLGQSALSAFGKISIDYKRNEIIFE